MEAFFHHFGDEKKLKDGTYILHNDYNVFLNPINVSVSNNVFTLIDENRVLTKEDLKFYTHFYQYDVLPDIDPMDWYIEYERIIDVKTVFCEEKNTNVYHFEDTKNHDIILFFDEHNNLNVDIINNKMLYMIPYGGWHNVKIPETASFDTLLVLNQPMISMLYDVLDSFSKHYSLSQIDKIESNNRGFSFVDILDLNDKIFGFQDSSVATEARIWFGLKDYIFKNNEDCFVGKEFEKMLKENAYPPVNALNSTMDSSVLYSSRMELSVFHAKAIMKIIKENI